MKCPHIGGRQGGGLNIWLPEQGKHPGFSPVQICWWSHCAGTLVTNIIMGVACFITDWEGVVAEVQLYASEAEEPTNTLVRGGMSFDVDNPLDGSHWSTADASNGTPGETAAKAVTSFLERKGQGAKAAGACSALKTVLPPSEWLFELIMMERDGQLESFLDAVAKENVQPESPSKTVPSPRRTPQGNRSRQRRQSVMMHHRLH